MQLKEFNILLDIKKHNKIDYIEVVTGDSFSNVINISLVDGINPYDLTNTSVEIVFSKSDGTTVQQTDIAVINAAQGKIQCILKTNTIAAPGKAVAEVRILEGETLLTSTRFEFYVRKAIINDETIESTNEFPVLTQLIATTNDLIQQVEQIEKQVPENVVTQLNQVSNLANQLQTDLAAHKAENVTQIGNFTRDLSLVGTQKITLPKKAKSISIFVCVGTPTVGKACWGNANANGNNCLFDAHNATPNTYSTDNSNAVAILDSTANRTLGAVTLIEDNGFTINWSHLGTGATGTARVIYNALFHGGA